MGRASTAIAAALTAVSTVATPQDWPQFRGPTGQGHAEERGLPLDWSESKNVLWKTPVPGAGWSSPVVGGGRVWLTSSVEERSGSRGRPTVLLRTLAFDVETGRQLVDVEVFRLERPRALNEKNTFASPTPVLDGDRVYVHFGADGTAALSSSGEVLWRTRLPYESQHGAGGSPALFGDLLIISCDGNDVEAFVVALDTRTGRERWKRHRRKPSDQAYTTPLAIRVGDQDQIVSVGAYRAAAYEPASGREIWRVSYEDGFSNVPRPVFGHGLVFIATGFQQPALIAVRADGQGDVTRTHIAWTLRRGAPYTPSPILVADELYILNDLGVLTVVDARTGSIHYQQRLSGGYSASPVFADGRIYLLSEEGVATVISPGTTFTRLAVNRIDGLTLASMAVAHGSFFIRSDSHLYRIGERQ
ncbi:MAG: outer membrane protein assembly factor BamB family protein [Acidobacteriota bacterium]